MFEGKVLGMKSAEPLCLAVIMFRVENGIVLHAELVDAAFFKE
jgi:hypothetical protein